MSRILIPLPDRDFDVTEVAVPWKLFTEVGQEVVFATEQGNKPAADPLLLEGVIFGQLGAKDVPLGYYRELERSPEFGKPLRWDQIDPHAFDAVVLPGGHAQGMKQYLEGKVLFSKIAAYAQTRKPLAAICHGVLVLARANLLKGRKTTCLPKYMEKIAYYSTAWKLGTYYRTYPAYVEDEVKAALDSPEAFVRGPLHLFSQGTKDDDSAAFVVEDGHYVSARWPGDAFLFAKKILARL